MLKRTWVMAAALLLLGGAARAEGLSRLKSDGTWIRDGHGRVVLLRGANLPAHTRPANFYADADLEALASFGFNFVRLGISWDKGEPEEGRYDFAYLDSAVALARTAGEHGLYVMPEVHKYGWCQPGSDMPEWTCSFEVSGGNFLGQAANADRFWRNPEMQAKLIKFWRILIERFRGLDNIMGYNPMNEPLASSMFLPGVFDRPLFRFYENWIAAARELDPDRPAVLEPCTANLIIPFFPPRFKHENLVYAPHPYYAHFQVGSRLMHEPETNYGIDKKYRRNAAEARRLHAPLLVGEYGGNPEDAFARRWLLHSWEVQDRYFAGAAIWVYDKSDGGWAILAKDGRPREFFWKHLRRPYPRATAGAPVELRFDADAGSFLYRFMPDPSLTAPTEIFIPREMGAKAKVSGGSFEWLADRELLLVRPAGAGEVRVTVE